MSEKIEQKLAKIPVVKNLVALLKRVTISQNSFSLYDFLELYIVGIVKGALTYRASAISFSFFLAIFPFLLFILNLIPYVPIDTFQIDVWSFIDGLLPPGTNELFSSIFFDIADNRRGGLLSSVFLLSILLMTNGIVAIFGGFESSYHVRITRTYVRQYMVALMVAIIIALLILIVIAMFIYYGIYIVPYLERTGLLYSTETIIQWSKIGFVTVIIYLATSILFFFGTKEGKKSKFFSIGSILTVLLFALTTYLFGIYIENFSQYNQLYGSIGALLIFLLYIWLNSNILLLGFELNASLLRLKKIR